MAGLLFRARTQIAVASALRQRGYGILEARRLAASIDEDTLHLAMSMAPPAVVSAVVPVGDGGIIQAILDFFASPLGQQLIQILISLLLGL